MEEDDLTSSSLTNCSYERIPSAAPIAPTRPAQFVHRRTEFVSTAPGKWVRDAVLECARAIAGRKIADARRLMGLLNEMSSPYGDSDEKLASYFLRALFCRVTGTGESCYRTLTSAAESAAEFESMRWVLLKFQEVSPWTTFGHVACNGAILEAAAAEEALHIVDVSRTFCTQWPTLLEALATRNNGDSPRIRITAVVTAGNVSASSSLMKEAGWRLEKFARLMGVPFSFTVFPVAGDLSELSFRDLQMQDDERLVVNCVGKLHSVPGGSSPRDAVLRAIRRLRPRLLTVVEDEADFFVGRDGADFLAAMQECVRWFSLYMECLDSCFPRVSAERLALELDAGRTLVDLLARHPADSVEQRESAPCWCRRLHDAGFLPSTFSSDVVDDLQALLRRYGEGWSITSSAAAGIFLAWKEQPAVWASAWIL